MKLVISLAIAFFVGITASPALAADQVEISGGHTLGSRQSDLDVNSSKFNEYRDIRDGFYLGDLWLQILDTRSGRFADFSGENLLRDDQSISLVVGDFKHRWRAHLRYDGIPHHLSNKAMTPYIYRGNGLFTVPGPVSILKDNNIATGTPSLVPTAGQMAVNDGLIAAYLQTHLHPVDLGTQRNRTEATLNLAGYEPIRFRLAYLDERKDGNRLTYGPIGDRPPRSVNIQFTEPVDYTTREVRADAEFVGKGVQTHLSYQFSVFYSNIEALRWENVYFAPDAGSDFIATVPGTARNVSGFGQRSLAPDNYAHSLSFSSGVDLPLNSRLTSAVALGIMRQDERLLPYSSSALGGDLHPTLGDGLNWNDTRKLPRERADADMRTLRVDLDYSITPMARFYLRPFLRYYDLDNRTPTAQWKYVTQDVAGTNGDVSYRNYRRNLAYAYDKLNIGIDARHYFSFWRTSLGLGYEREGIDRDFREANTDENIFRASVRTRPANRLSLSAGYLYGDRKSDGYDYNVTSQSYWYSFGQGAADVDNPQFLFANHPDLRKYDVSDRKRHDFHGAATFAVRNDFDLSAVYRYRKDDFDSNVGPVAPIAGTAVPLPNPADANAQTPGQQLGLLEDKRQNITIDAHYAPDGRWHFTAFADREHIDATQRGMVYNENQRREPSNAGIQAPAALGPWTDSDRLYLAKTKQITHTLGMGMGYELIPNIVRFAADYSLSRGRVDLDYTGYGSDVAFLGRNWETFDFGFNDPETAWQKRYVLNASLSYHMNARLSWRLNYAFDQYRIEDWTEEPSGPWVEQVDSAYFWRDTSRDNRWGNRLIALGSTLAPGYRAHIVSLAMTSRF